MWGIGQDKDPIQMFQFEGVDLTTAAFVLTRYVNIGVMKITFFRSWFPLPMFCFGGTSMETFRHLDLTEKIFESEKKKFVK